MGKTKTKSRSGSSKDILHSTSAHVKSTTKPKPKTKSTEDLLTEAAVLLEQSQPDLALPLVDEALRRLEAEREHYKDLETLLAHSAAGQPTFPEALTLSADVYLAVGGIEEARIMFERAVDIDPDGALISAEPWLYLAQLCEEGGNKSIEYFEKATDVLRNEAEVLEDALEELQGEERAQHQYVVDDKRAKVAEALCAMAEVYMTDLSWERDAESRCESYVTEALAVCPERLSAGTLQTLASVRISQERIEEARQALARSMLIWKDLPEEVDDPVKPQFPTRISLVRLLMDVNAEPEAMWVVEGLIKEDDQSVEGLYLAGWCQLVLSQKEGLSSDEKHKHEEQALVWLGNCLKLYKAQQYEDVKLHKHALELVATLNQSLGIDGGEEDEWEDDDDDDDSEVDDNDDLVIGANGEHDHHNGDVEMT